jgi:hypothetical protein
MSDTNKPAMPLDDLPRPGVAIPLQRWLDLLAIEQKCAKQVEEIARLREALDNCPWPQDVWTGTIEDVGANMRAQLGDVTTTAISGVLMRHGWMLARKAVEDALTPAQPAAKP